jgi:membrane-bound lytic murein transglycosylase B
LSAVPVLLRIVVALSVLASVLTGARSPTAVRAQAPDGTESPVPPEPTTPMVPDPRVSPQLLAVPVDSAAYRAAVARFRDAESRLTTARETFAAAEATLGELHAADARLVATGNEASRKRRKAENRVEELRRNVREFAVASYMLGGIGDLDLPTLDLDRINDRTRQRVIARTVSAQQLADLAANLDQLARSDAVLTQVAAEATDVRRRLDDTVATRDRAIADGNRAAADLERAGRQVADARLEAEVVGLDFRFVVLDAYVKGAAAMAVERPQCALPWTALAGVGRTESGHGTFAGSSVRANGDVTRPIIGIPLDGTNSTAVIGDSDGGQLDGDPGVDRAVGPMQFIPTSWRAFGRDGNGDGRADPQNMYDAALAAAVLLCRGQPLDSDAGLRSAFLRYNNSSAYARLVLERTRRYDQFVIPPVA